MVDQLEPKPRRARSYADHVRAALVGATHGTARLTGIMQEPLDTDREIIRTVYDNGEQYTIWIRRDDSRDGSYIPARQVRYYRT